MVALKKDKRPMLFIGLLSFYVIYTFNFHNRLQFSALVSL